MQAFAHPKNLLSNFLLKVQSICLTNNVKLDIVQTLDQVEINSPKDIPLHVETEQRFQTATHSYEFQDEYNQEYWSGQHCDSYSQEYPEDWLRRTQQRPHPKSSNTTY